MGDAMSRDRLATRSVLGVMVLVWIVLLIFRDQPISQPWLMALITGVLLLVLQVWRMQWGVKISILTSVLGVLAILIGLYNLFVGNINFLHPIIPWTPILMVVFILIMLFGETFFEGRLN